MNDLFPTAVYLLCFLTSTACAWLLGRSYMRTRTPLLFWSSLCFGLLALNNLLLVADLIIFMERIDLRIPRVMVSFAATFVLLFGFIWGMKED